jgi:transcriptional regulator with XRE-family HTH domain
LRFNRKKLLRARELLGYGIEKVAEEAGVSKNSVLRAEHEGDIRPLTARRIAAALGVSVADLIGESETLKAQPPLPEFPEERRVPTLKSWTALAQRFADRWEAEITEREAEWRDAKPAVQKHVIWLPNLSWAIEIRATATDLLAEATEELELALDAATSEEAPELFAALRRLNEVVERTDAWYSSAASVPETAEVIDLLGRLGRIERKIGARAS